MGFAGVLALLGIMGVISCWNMLRWRDALGQVQATEVRLAQISSLVSEWSELEVAEAAFRLSQDSQFLEAHQNAAVELTASLRKLHELSGDAPGLTARVASLEKLCQERLAVSRTILVAAATNNGPFRLRLVADPAQVELRKQIRRAALEIQQADQAFLRDTELALQKRSAVTLAGVLVGAFLVILMVAWAWAMVNQDTLGRRRAEELLRAANDQLEAGVRDRTAALSRSLASLTESEARLAGIISSAMDGIITVDGALRIVLFNEAAEKLFQRRAPEMIGQPLDVLIPERYRGLHQELMRRFGETDITRRAVGTQEAIYGLRADGEEFPIEASISQLQFGGGRLFSVILRDITDRHRAEQVLRERAALETRLSKIVATAPGVLYAFRLAPDGAQSFPFVSPTVVHLLGLHPEELARSAEPSLAMIHPDDADRVRANILKSARELTPWREEYRVSHPRRGELWLEGNSIPERETDGGTLWYGVLRDISDRKLAEQQIRYQFQLLKGITDRAAECIFVTDLNGRVTFANPEAERVFGFPLEELVGESLHEMIHHHHPDGQPFPPEDCLLEHGQVSRQSVRNQELSFFRKDGSPVPTLCSTASLEVGSRPVGVVLVARDISDLKRAESALRLSNAQLEAAQELAGMSSFEVDLATQRIAWSRPSARLIGFDPARPPATLSEFLDYIHPADRGLFGGRNPNWLQGVRLEAFDFRSNPERGMVRHFAAIVDLVADGAGRPSKCKGTILDVTQRHRTDVALRESEERLRQIAATLRDAIWLVDSQTQQVLYVNPAFETICGRTCDEFYRNPEVFNELIHPEDKERVLRAHFNGASLGAIEERHRIIRPDGALRWVQSRTVAVKNEAGESYRIASIIENVTKRVEAEHLQRSLEEQLRQAQKMDAIGTLAGGIAHDFNNVLAGILGSVELAQMEISPEHSAQQFLQSIHFASNRARELVQQILTFSRRQEGEKMLLELQPIVGECVKLLRSTIPAMVRITNFVELTCPPVMADPIQIHQVIMNICTNAWHALPAANGHIEVRLQCQTVSDTVASQHTDLEAGEYVCLKITDNGHGMDLATQQRIFEPFFTTKPSGKGTGLGLSVAHGIIKSHQGAIQVESAPGQGATFTVYLPAQPVSSSEEPAPPRKLTPGQGERILFVDDEQNLAAVTEKVLTRIGYAVTRFNRAEFALEKFREAPGQFELVITDLAMPGMSGLDLASALFQVRADLPILLISGFADQPVHEAAKVIGIREVLMKPLSIEALSDAVTRALAGSRRPSV